MTWATISTTESRFKVSLIARARKRTVEGPFPGNRFIVAGNPSLSDAHERYVVQVHGLDDDPVCSCQSHEHGQYRPVCSHGIAALLHVEDHGVELEPPVAESYPPAGEGDPPASPSPGPVPAEPQGFTSVDTAPGDLPPPGDRAWGQPGLPLWLHTIPAHQQQAIASIEDAYARGAQAVVLSAPTGTGKTVIAELTRRRLGSQAVYAATTKTLQAQVLADFDYARVLQGRDNYPTELAPERFDDDTWRLSCADCTWTSAKPSCQWCSSKAACPYEVAKADALDADLAVLNTAYFLTEANGPGKVSGRDLVILDEADTLESALMSHAEVRISRSWAQRLNLEPPSIVTHTAKKAVSTWRAWAEDAYAQVSDARTRYSDHDEDPGDVRARKHLDGLKAKLRMLIDGLADDDDPAWVYVDDRDGNIVFRPVTVSQLGPSLLWRHGERFLLMSASVISAQEMMDSLGMQGRWEHVEVPSTFAPERRPVYATPVADVTSKAYDEAVPQLRSALARIAEQHYADNILVHSVSYKLARDLVTYLDGAPNVEHEIISYTSAQGRNRALSKFRDRGRPAIMVAPSLARGVDLPDDACRVVVVAKIPYPYLGDRQVHARLYSPGGQVWYQVATVRAIVQMTGRAMRHGDDHSVSYVLDRQFLSLWRKAKHLFPSWWTDALSWSLPPWMGGGG